MPRTKWLLQSALLATYRSARRTTLLRTRWGETAFAAAYDIYKRTIEAGAVHHLAPFVRPGTVAVDVGAHVGFFTRRFGRWVAEGGRVIAIEPEAANFSRLEAAVARAGLSPVVELVHAAAAERSGTAMLALNPDHPADHKLAPDGIPVVSVTIDELLAARGSPPVSLIKIDVQGSEMRVLEGAGGTLARCRPALFVEIDEGNLRAAGSSARQLVDRITGLGYKIHRLTRAGVSAALAPREILDEMSETGRYLDVLFLPPAATMTGMERG